MEDGTFLRTLWQEAAGVVVDGMTIEDAEHQIAARLYQNTAKVHFNQFERAKDPSGRRLVYGGVIISTAKALSFNGLQNAGLILAIMVLPTLVTNIFQAVYGGHFLKLIRLLVERRSAFAMFGGVRFGGTVTLDNAWALGFDHVALAMGAGKPTTLNIPNGLARGVRTASGEIGSGTVHEYMQVLFQERSWGSMAESETYAHLEHLRLTGEATVDESGEQLLYRFS